MMGTGMMSAGTDPGKVMGTLFANAPGFAAWWLARSWASQCPLPQCMRARKRRAARTAAYY